MRNSANQPLLLLFWRIYPSSSNPITVGKQVESPRDPFSAGPDTSISAIALGRFVRSYCHDVQNHPEAYSRVLGNGWRSRWRNFAACPGPRRWHSCSFIYLTSSFGGCPPPFSLLVLWSYSMEWDSQLARSKCSRWNASSPPPSYR